MKRQRGVMVAITATLVFSMTTVVGASAAPLGQITEFTAGLPRVNAWRFEHVAAGPDGNVWFTLLEKGGGAGYIGRSTQAGQVKLFSLPNTAPEGIAGGPDGNMWFTDALARIGRITPTGQVTEFSNGLNPLGSNAPSAPIGITAGPDGNMWFTDPGAESIDKITMAGVITRYTDGLGSAAPNTEPQQIVLGPDGNLWFSELFFRGVEDPKGISMIGRITPAGAITEFPLGPGSYPADLAPGPDGTVWFIDASLTKPAIGRITPTGTVTEVPVHSKAFLYAIGRGSDGNMWFLDNSRPKSIGRITPAGTITEFSNGLQPNNDSGLIDITAGPGGDMWFVDNGDHLAVGSIGTGAVSVGGKGGGGSAGCKVPNLMGKTLQRARTPLKRNGCRLGSIHRRKVANKHKRGRVVAQSPRAGRVLPPNGRVNVTLGK